VSYRPYLESGALGQMHGLPEQAFEMLVTLLSVGDEPPDTTGEFLIIGHAGEPTQRCGGGG